MNKKAVAKVLEIVKTYVDSLVKTDTGQPLPIGYTPIETIRGGLFHWVLVPFNGKDIWCQLRCPNATQIEQCGDMSNIQLKTDQDGKFKYDYDEIILIRNYQENLAKLCLNIPTFDNIATLVGANDFIISEKRKELDQIEKYYEENKETMTETQKSTIDHQIKTLRLMIGFILPDDTMAFLCSWAMGNDVSDIKKITRENLLKAASIAKAHNKAPSDYLSGVFTDFNKQEIDTYAFSILDEFLKEQRAIEGGGGKHRWLLGRGKSNNLPKQPGGK